MELSGQRGAPPFLFVSRRAPLATTTLRPVPSLTPAARSPRLALVRSPRLADLDDALPAGNEGDTTGNSLACRAYHAFAAGMSPATHCGHAGPTGGDINPQDQSPGPCGEACDSFCTVAVGVCTGAHQVFNDMNDCLTQCKTFKAATAPYSMSTWNKAEFTSQVYTLAKAADLAESYYLELCLSLGAQP
jgi:hypothetical protein